MAADWVPAVTAGIGAAAAIGGQAVSGLFQGRNQERAEERQRRERAVAVVADVLGWLIDANPGELRASVPRERFVETIADLRTQLDAIRKILLNMSVGHPSEKIRGLSAAMALALVQSWASTGSFVTLRQDDEDLDREGATALRDHGQALKLIGDFAEAARNA